MKKNRQQQILELLTNENRIEVVKLSQMLEVSQVTIRKDLDELERLGIIVRERGFAILRSKDDINGRIAYHYEEKLKIARLAAQLIKDGDTLMIESGSCCALLADTLAAQRKNLTIITNSAYIADHIRTAADFDIVLLGGIYQNDAQVMVGPMVRQCADNFYVDHFFIGVDGFTDRTGFTHADQLRAQAVRDMAQHSEQIVVLTESEKFGKRGVVPLNLKGLKIKVITDNQITDTYKNMLAEQNIGLSVVH